MEYMPLQCPVIRNFHLLKMCIRDRQYALLLLLGVLMAVAGLYAGYTYGFQIKSKAYFAGFLCLLAADVEFIVRFLVA